MRKLYSLRKSQLTIRKPNNFLPRDVITCRAECWFLLISTLEYIIPPTTKVTGLYCIVSLMLSPPQRLLKNMKFEGIEIALEGIWYEDNSNFIFFKSLCGGEFNACCCRCTAVTKHAYTGYITVIITINRTFLLQRYYVFYVWFSYAKTVLASQIPINNQEEEQFSRTWCDYV